MYVVCLEHVERAIDEFVEIYETPPDFYELTEVRFTDWAAPSMCNFCSNPPRFLIV